MRPFLIPMTVQQVTKHTCAWNQDWHSSLILALISVGRRIKYLLSYMFTLQITAGSTITTIFCAPASPCLSALSNTHARTHLKFLSKWVFTRTHILHPPHSLECSDVSQ